MSELSELKEFQRKLVKARADSKRGDYWWLRPSLSEGGFHWYTEAKPYGDLIADWYFADGRTYDERKAMWDNSIAALDARIAKLEGK